MTTDSTNATDEARRDASALQRGVRPLACCTTGTYECQVPMPLNGRVQGVDYCIADLVAALNAANVRTVASCCGHGDESIAVISLADGRELRVARHTRYWARPN